jgi:hypothetical protein
VNVGLALALAFLLGALLPLLTNELVWTQSIQRACTAFVR